MESKKTKKELLIKHIMKNPLNTDELFLYL